MQRRNDVVAVRQSGVCLGAMASQTRTEVHTASNLLRKRSRGIRLQARSDHFDICSRCGSLKSSLVREDYGRQEKVLG